MTLNPLRPRFTRVLYQIHKWTGLIAALPLCLILLTGAISVFHDELDAWLTPGRLVASQGPKASLSRITAVLGQTFPTQPLSGLEFPTRPGVAITAYLSPSFEVFVDPITGAVTGTRHQETFPTFLRRLHVRFNVQQWWARVVVGIFGIALLTSSTTGALIYLPFMRGVFRMGLPFWKLRRTVDPQLRWADLHRLLGITSLGFNLLIGTTGVVFGMLPLLRFAPSIDQHLHPAPHPMHDPPLTKRPISPDQALSIAQSTWPGMTPASILFPSHTAPRYTVYANFPGTLMRGAASYVTIHAFTGAVLEQYDARRERTLVYAYNWTEPLHYGAYGGTAVKWIYFLFGLCGAALTITGPVIQFLKSRRRERLGS